MRIIIMRVGLGTTLCADLTEFNLYFYADIFLSCADDTEVLELDDVGNSIVEQIISNSNAVKRSGNLTASTYDRVLNII